MKMEKEKQRSIRKIILWYLVVYTILTFGFSYLYPIIAYYLIFFQGLIFSIVLVNSLIKVHHIEIGGIRKFIFYLAGQLIFFFVMHLYVNTILHIFSYFIAGAAGTALFLFACLIFLHFARFGRMLAKGLFFILFLMALPTVLFLVDFANFFEIDIYVLLAIGFLITLIWQYYIAALAEKHLAIIETRPDESGMEETVS